ncbi:unnamed protein product [Amoebophrya sp. A25]|nr:unnamed protein product [Amoebophrya sp. A25]|eukprot:GSA25T00018479001.1
MERVARYLVPHYSNTSSDDEPLHSSYSMHAYSQFRPVAADELLAPFTPTHRNDYRDNIHNNRDENLDYSSTTSPSTFSQGNGKDTSTDEVEAEKDTSTKEGEIDSYGDVFPVGDEASDSSGVIVGSQAIGDSPPASFINVKNSKQQQEALAVDPENRVTDTLLKPEGRREASRQRMYKQYSAHRGLFERITDHGLVQNIQDSPPKEGMLRELARAMFERITRSLLGKNFEGASQMPEEEGTEHDFVHALTQFELQTSPPSPTPSSAEGLSGDSTAMRNEREFSDQLVFDLSDVLYNYAMPLLEYLQRDPHNPHDVRLHSAQHADLSNKVGDFSSLLDEAVSQLETDSKALSYVHNALYSELYVELEQRGLGHVPQDICLKLREAKGWFATDTQKDTLENCKAKGDIDVFLEELDDKEALLSDVRDRTKDLRVTSTSFPPQTATPRETLSENSCMSRLHYLEKKHDEEVNLLNDMLFISSLLTVYLGLPDLPEANFKKLDKLAGAMTRQYEQDLDALKKQKGEIDREAEKVEHKRMTEADKKATADAPKSNHDLENVVDASSESEKAAATLQVQKQSNHNLQLVAKIFADHSTLYDKLIDKIRTLTDTSRIIKGTLFGLVKLQKLEKCVSTPEPAPPAPAPSSPSLREKIGDSQKFQCLLAKFRAYVESVLVNSDSDTASRVELAEILQKEPSPNSNAVMISHFLLYDMRFVFASVRGLSDTERITGEAKWKETDAVLAEMEQQMKKDRRFMLEIHLDLYSRLSQVAAQGAVDPNSQAILAKKIDSRIARAHRDKVSQRHAEGVQVQAQGRREQGEIDEHEEHEEDFFKASVASFWKKYILTEENKKQLAALTSAAAPEEEEMATHSLPWKEVGQQKSTTSTASTDEEKPYEVFFTLATQHHFEIVLQEEMAEILKVELKLATEPLEDEERKLQDLRQIGDDLQSQVQEDSRALKIQSFIVSQWLKELREVFKEKFLRGDPGEAPFFFQVHVKNFFAGTLDTKSAHLSDDILLGCDPAVPKADALPQGIDVRNKITILRTNAAERRDRIAFKGTSSQHFVDSNFNSLYSNTAETGTATKFSAYLSREVLRGYQLYAALYTDMHFYYWHYYRRFCPSGQPKNHLESALECEYDRVVRLRWQLVEKKICTEVDSDDSTPMERRSDISRMNKELVTLVPPICPRLPLRPTLEVRNGLEHFQTVPLRKEKEQELLSQAKQSIIDLRNEMQKMDKRRKEYQWLVDHGGKVLPDSAIAELPSQINKLEADLSYFRIQVYDLSESVQPPHIYHEGSFDDLDHDISSTANLISSGSSQSATIIRVVPKLYLYAASVAALAPPPWYNEMNIHTEIGRLQLKHEETIQLQKFAYSEIIPQTNGFAEIHVSAFFGTLRQNAPAPILPAAYPGEELTKMSWGVEIAENNDSDSYWPPNLDARREIDFLRLEFDRRWSSYLEVVKIYSQHDHDKTTSTAETDDSDFWVDVVAKGFTLYTELHSNMWIYYCTFHSSSSYVQTAAPSIGKGGPHVGKWTPIEERLRKIREKLQREGKPKEEVAKFAPLRQKLAEEGKTLEKMRKKMIEEGICAEDKDAWCMPFFPRLGWLPAETECDLQVRTRAAMHAQERSGEDSRASTAEKNELNQVLTELTTEIQRINDRRIKYAQELLFGTNRFPEEEDFAFRWIQWKSEEAAYQVNRFGHRLYYLNANVGFDVYHFDFLPNGGISSKRAMEITWVAKSLLDNAQLYSREWDQDCAYELGVNGFDKSCTDTVRKASETPRADDAEDGDTPPGPPETPGSPGSPGSSEDE